MNLGPYKLAGQVATKGQVSRCEEKITSVTGTLSAQQLVLASPDGNSVSEPQANVDFALSIDRQQQAVAIQNLTANASFGTISVQNGTVPLGSASPVPLNLVVTATNVDLNKLEPYGVLFASLPKEPHDGRHRPIPGDRHPEADRVSSLLRRHPHPELPGGLRRASRPSGSRR